MSLALDSFIDERVHTHYWEDSLNCAQSTLLILGEIFTIEIEDQLLKAATALNGAGCYGSQCGLVDGGLLFIGILGSNKQLSKQEISKISKDFVITFKSQFGSFMCADLRPECVRIHGNNHSCEEMSKKSVKITVAYITEQFNKSIVNYQ